MDAALNSPPLSWRDPAGFVVRHQGRILRAVTPDKAEQTRKLIGSAWFASLVAEGAIPTTTELAEGPPGFDECGQWLWLEHAAVAFPAYPHEITALQLFDAARLTLRLAIAAAENGWTLKDASAWNVLFSAGRPVFVDLLSFDRDGAPNGTWLAYGQFVRHFLLPLLLHKRLSLTPAELFLSHRDGITPERAHAFLSGLARWSPAALELVVLPKLLAQSGSRLIAAQTRRQPKSVKPDLAKALLMRTLNRLQRLLGRLEPDARRSRSTWADYEVERDHYAADDLEVKRAFVATHLGESRRVLDLGCNAGEFSLLAAESAALVVATDSDHAALERLYARIRGKEGRISPIFLDIGRPTPGVGWENLEVASFMDRATEQFDCILMLGLMHHLLVSERASLPMIVDWLERFQSDRLIVEWIDPHDRRFAQLAGLNMPLYGNLNEALMEECFGRKFRLSAKLALPHAKRIMYSWRR